MPFDREQVVEMLRARGDTEQAEKGTSELPDPVDTDAHAELLEKYGINVQDLLGGAGGLIS